MAAELSSEFRPDVRALITAARRGDLDGVTSARAAGADIDARTRLERTPLICAVLERRTRAAGTLVAAGADWTLGDSDGATALHWAAADARTELLTTLLDAGVDPSVPNTVTGAGPLHAALMSGRKDSLRVLLRRGSAVSAADRTGDTALHRAAKVNAFGAVLTLLRAGADPAAVNGRGATFRRYLDTADPRVLSGSARWDLRRIRRHLERAGAS